MICGNSSMEEHQLGGEHLKLLVLLARCFHGLVAVEAWTHHCKRCFATSYCLANSHSCSTGLKFLPEHLSYLKG